VSGDRAFQNCNAVTPPLIFKSRRSDAGLNAWLCRASQKKHLHGIVVIAFAIRYMGRGTVANVHWVSSSSLSLVVPLTTSVRHDLQERPGPN
jgi:hypothetical protein